MTDIAVDPGTIPDAATDADPSATERLVDAYLDAWRATDEATRRDLVARVFAADGRHVDPMADVAGHDALVAMLAGVHAAYPGFAIERTSGVDRLGRLQHARERPGQLGRQGGGAKPRAHPDFPIEQLHPQGVELGPELGIHAAPDQRRELRRGEHDRVGAPPVEGVHLRVRRLEGAHTGPPSRRGGSGTNAVDHLAGLVLQPVPVFRRRSK